MDILIKNQFDINERLFVKIEIIFIYFKNNKKFY
jgi:hypothetical protein